jgi:hypothetical protein
MFFRSLDDLTSELPDAGSTGSDAATDGGPPAEASPPDVAPGASPCTSVSHTLCVDFDHGPLSTGWSGQSISAGMELSLDSNLALSQPNSLLAAVPRRTQTNQYAAVNAKRDGLYEHGVLDFDAYLAKSTYEPGDVGIALGLLGFYSDSARTGTVLFTSTAGTSVLSIEDKVNSTYFDGPLIPTDRWFHVHLDFDVHGTYSWSIDGVTGSRSFPAVTLSGSPNASIAVGLLGYNAPGPATRAQYDNVVLDLE